MIARGIYYWLRLDFSNYMRYGSNAPTFCELVYVNPRDIKSFTYGPIMDHGNVIRRDGSGRVIAGDWDLNAHPMEELPKYNICCERYINGKSWEESGAYELMRNSMELNSGADGCYTFKDVVHRYERLDGFYREIAQSRRLRERRDLYPKNFRERGGVYVHIGRTGDLIFGRGGCHRLAISKILDLPKIPVQLGVVHEEAIDIWPNKVSRVPDPYSMDHWKRW